MSTWGIIAIIVGILVVVASLLTATMGKEERAARRELRRLRRRERNPNLSGAREHRYNMLMGRIPGKDTLPGGP
jgi:hypothetical protein